MIKEIFSGGLHLWILRNLTGFIKSALCILCLRVTVNQTTISALLASTISARQQMRQLMASGWIARQKIKKCLWSCAITEGQFCLVVKCMLIRHQLKVIAVCYMHIYYPDSWSSLKRCHFQKQTALLISICFYFQGPAYSVETVGTENYVRAIGAKHDLIAIYEFELLFMASYVVWKETFSMTNKTNDVSFRVDEGEWYLWHLPYKGSSSLWTQYYLQVCQLFLIMLHAYRAYY